MMIVYLPHKLFENDKNVEGLALDYVFADTGNLGTTDSFRRFDIAFEQSSGKLVIIYDKDVSDTNDFYWRTYDGSTLSSESGGSGYIGSSADSEEIRYIRSVQNGYRRNSDGSA